MNSNFYPWLAVLLYAIGIVFLAVVGRRHRQTIESFAIGSRSSSPVFIGISLAANMTSAATFVINPGLVYLYGVSGFLGYAIAAPLGIFLGLTLMSKKFRKIGGEKKALTVPQWIGERYGDRRITLFFAILSLLQITFIVLIVVGLTIVVGRTLNVPFPAVLGVLLVFTIGYIMMGGASVHILTNSLQGAIMASVAILLLISAPVFAQIPLTEIFHRLGNIDPFLLSATNPKSLLFRDVFEVFVANFLVGVAIICQPHILSKALYLRSERETNIYLLTYVLMGTLFFMVLFTGLYARALLPGEVLAPDQSMAAYINHVFPRPVLALVTLGILAAGFSTLEGLFIALSTIFSVDIFRNLRQLNSLPNPDTAAYDRRVLQATRIFLIALGIATYFLSLNQIYHPSLSVAIFAQNGVYGLFVATFWPLFLGLFFKNVPRYIPLWAAIVGLAVHFGVYYFKITHYHNNPGVAAAFALVASALFVASGMGIQKLKGAT